MYPGMYGPFIPDMYSYNFVHYDKFAGSDPILERPITTTGYSDLVDSPTGEYQLIQPYQDTYHNPLLKDSSVYKEKFGQENNNNSIVKIILLSLIISFAIYFLMNIFNTHFGGLSYQTNIILFILFLGLYIAIWFYI